MLRIVLVEPQEAGNVGAVARAMKNFGFDDLIAHVAATMLQHTCDQLMLASRQHQFDETKQLASQIATDFVAARNALHSLQKRYA